MSNELCLWTNMMLPESFSSMSRREAVARCGLGMAGLGVGMLLGKEALAAQPLGGSSPAFCPAGQTGHPPVSQWRSFPRRYV